MKKCIIGVIVCLANRCNRSSFFYILLLSSFILLSFYSFFSPSSQKDCEIRNSAFSSGEEVSYEIWYNWSFVWLNAGKVTFKVEKEQYNSMPVYKLSGVGSTYPSYDWIFKVRDKYESWVDTATLKPYRYVRDTKEGGYVFYNECFFNYKRLKVYCVTKEKNKMPRLDTVAITPCALDPITMIYYSRNIDFSKCKGNDTVPITLFLDNRVYPLYIRYLGKDKLKLGDNTLRDCIKFSPLLIEGTLFKGGEGMTVWVTDDDNKIPLYVETPILVGTIKAKISEMRGFKNNK